jgi:4-alpha-glucanotransferase
MEKDNFAWWMKRLKRVFAMHDVVRIDHFRGFSSYYSIDGKAENARNGKWVDGPGMKLFDQIKKELGDVNIIAEDLGFLTEDVFKLLKDTGYPGMKVLQFGFSDGRNEYLPHNFATSNCFAYTGTHDNETLKGWVDSLDKKSLKFAKQYLNVEKKKDIPMAVVRAAWGSVAKVASAQIQDFLESPEEDRMNTPSTLGSNWQFRTKESDFTPELAKKIKKAEQAL